MVWCMIGGNAPNGMPLDSLLSKCGMLALFWGGVELWILKSMTACWLIGGAGWTIIFCCEETFGTTLSIRKIPVQLELNREIEHFLLTLTTFFRNSDGTIWIKLLSSNRVKSYLGGELINFDSSIYGFVCVCVCTHDFTTSAPIRQLSILCHIICMLELASLGFGKLYFSSVNA